MGLVNSKSYGTAGSFLEYDRIIYHLKRGDLIEIQRTRHNISYKHWVICESIDSKGNVWCFHVTTPNVEQSTGETNREQGVRNEIPLSGRAQLRYESLEDILKDNDGKPSLCRVNNQTEMARQMLAKVNSEAPDLDQVFDILHRSKDSTLKYDLTTNNCEHYCTFWKYGIGWSSQVNTFKEIVATELEITSKATNVAAALSGVMGWRRMGNVCLLVSNYSSEAADVVKGIETTFDGMKV